LGVVSESDLSSNISEAILALEAGKYSKPVVTDGSTQIFFVEDRFGASDEGREDGDLSEAQEKARRDEARKAIQKRKTEEKLSSYFGVELRKNHTVDKKF
jgi:parvulin-like peptidyl-prolyl isomerase